MAADPGTSPEDQPLPEGGWSEQVIKVTGAIAVPPVTSGLVQAAGLLRADGSYCAEGALWRKYRPITTRPEMPDSPPGILPGRWLWGGVLWRHFGHFLVESSSRLWALSYLKMNVDGILFIPKRPWAGAELLGYQREFFDLFSAGIPVHVATKPVQAEELIVPGQGFGLGKITRGTKSFRGAVRRSFARGIAPEGPPKIYISRSRLGGSTGGLLGEEHLEARLQDEGYEIFHPQEHSLAEQIARYKAAEQVVAADGSALHLFSMVGHRDQKVAIILRRKSSADDLLAANVASFCGIDPLLISALRTEWVPEKKPKSSRLSFGELDHAVIGLGLSKYGFISAGSRWPRLKPAARRQLLADKGLDQGYIESPEAVRRRKREQRRRDQAGAARTR